VARLPLWARRRGSARVGRTNQPDFRAICEASPGLHLILDRDLTIVEASNAYLAATDTRRETVVGRPVFEVLPDNPATPEVQAVRNSAASFERVLRLGKPDAMPVQRYDMRPRGGDGPSPAYGDFQERYWRTVNTPVPGPDGAVAWIIHQVEDVTEATLAAQGGQGDRSLVGLLRAGNAVLRDLPDALFARLAGNLTPVRLPADALLIEPGEAVKTIHFPLYGLISISRHLEDGASVEVALCGQDAFVGGPALNDNLFEDTEARTLVAGASLSCRTRALQDLQADHPELSAVLGRFLPLLMDQMSLSAACLARHTLDQRLARWLLTAANHTGSHVLPVRQESLAQILGVRRTGISEAMARLEAAGVAANGRGRIHIRDVVRLEGRSCSCFRELQDHRVAHALNPRAAPLESRSTIDGLMDRYFALAGADGLDASTAGSTSGQTAQSASRSRTGAASTRP
jgi:CRP-like cAMP-binding protein